MALRRVAVQCDAVPERLRIHSPAEMRYGVGIAVLLAFAPVLEPVAHQLGVDAAVDAGDMPFADFELHRIAHVAAVGQDDDVAGLEDDRAGREAFIRAGVNMTAAP